MGYVKRRAISLPLYLLPLFHSNFFSFCLFIYLFNWFLSRLFYFFFVISLFCCFSSFFHLPLFDFFSLFSIFLSLTLLSLFLLYPVPFRFLFVSPFFRIILIPLDKQKNKDWVNGCRSPRDHVRGVFLMLIHGISFHANVLREIKGRNRNKNWNVKKEHREHWPHQDYHQKIRKPKQKINK